MTPKHKSLTTLDPRRNTRIKKTTNHKFLAKSKSSFLLKKSKRKLFWGCLWPSFENYFSWKIGLCYANPHMDSILHGEKQKNLTKPILRKLEWLARICLKRFGKPRVQKMNKMQTCEKVERTTALRCVAIVLVDHRVQQLTEGGRLVERRRCFYHFSFSLQTTNHIKHYIIRNQSYQTLHHQLAIASNITSSTTNHIKHYIINYQLVNHLQKLSFARSYKRKQI